MKRIFFGTLSLVFLMATAACSSEESTSDNGKRTVTFWGDWGGEGGAYFETMTSAFNESQDEIEVEYVVQEDLITQFLTASTSGQSPDLIFWDRWRTPLYAPRGVLHSIDDLIADSNVDRDNYYEQALNELTYDGNLYGMPLSVDARALFYNKTHLEEAGLEPPTNWEELRTAARELTIWDGDKLQRSGLSLGDQGLFNMWLQQAGGSMMDENEEYTAFNSPEGEIVLEFWDQLMNEDRVYRTGFDSDQMGPQHPFITQNVSLYYGGPWEIEQFDEYGDGLEYGVVAPPAGPEGDLGSVMGGFGLAIAEASQNKEDAWEFIKWWVDQPENMQLWAETSGSIPANKIVLEESGYEDDPIIGPFIETFDFAKVRPAHPGYSIMENDVLIPNLQRFLQGDQTLEETLNEAQRQGDAILDENTID